MNEEEIKETLYKQLELLSKRSEEQNSDLPALTHAMIEIVAILNASIA